MYLAQKRNVTITLDITCHEDLDLEDINWREMLRLEHDEDIHVSIREAPDIW